MPTKRIAAGQIEYHVDHDDDSTFTKIAGVKSITDPSKDYDMVDITDLDDVVEQMEPSGVKKMGELKLTLYWDQADTSGQGLIETLYNNKTKVNHQIKLDFSDGAILKTYAGYVKMLGEVVHTVKGEVLRDVTIQPTSDVTVS